MGAESGTSNPDTITMFGERKNDANTVTYTDGKEFSV